MTQEDEDRNADRFYNVDRVKETFRSQSSMPPPHGLHRRFARLVGRVVDSMSGFLSALVGIPILFGGIIAVIVGVLYGPLVFLLAVGTTFGFLSFYLNKKVGKSLRFGNFSLPLLIVAQVAALALAIAFFLALLVLPKLL